MSWTNLLWCHPFLPANTHPAHNGRLRCRFIHFRMFLKFLAIISILTFMCGCKGGLNKHSWFLPSFFQLCICGVSLSWQRKLCASMSSTHSKLLQQTVVGLCSDQTSEHSCWKVELLSITTNARVEALRKADGKYRARNVIMWQYTCTVIKEWSSRPNWFSLLCLSLFCFRTETSDQRKWKVQTHLNPNP